MRACCSGCLGSHLVLFAPDWALFQNPLPGFGARLPGASSYMEALGCCVGDFSAMNACVHQNRLNGTSAPWFLPHEDRRRLPSVPGSELVPCHFLRVQSSKVRVCISDRKMLWLWLVSRPFIIIRIWWQAWGSRTIPSRSSTCRICTMENHLQLTLHKHTLAAAKERAKNPLDLHQEIDHDPP